MNELSKKYTTQNGKAWDEIADIRHASQPSLDFFRNGGSTLGEAETATLGDVSNRSLLHLLCATGEDTISWALRGARVTGVDISRRQIEIAQQTADELGLDATFVVTDIYDFDTKQFDIVYTGGGAIVWLPELTQWAQIVSRSLKPNGVFLLYEEHPISMCFSVIDRNLVLEDDYFSREKPFEGPGWVHFEAPDAVENKYEFGWPIGDIITAIADAGLRIERLEEYPSDASWRFGDKLDEVSRLPGKYLLVASNR